MGNPRPKRIEDDDAPGVGDTLLPAQFWAALSDPRSEPEKRLMVAVLEEAIGLVVNGAARTNSERNALAREAERWLESDDHSAPFAFASICDVLGLEASRVRQALVAWRARRRVFRRPRLQAGRGRHLVRSGDRCRAA
jgi:hypothetical protein